MTVRDVIYRWRIPLVGLALVAIATGLAAGLLRNPIYNAEARITVGSSSLQAQAVPSYVASLPTIISTYARYVGDSTQDLTSIGQRLNGDPGSVVSISASPIPDSAIIRISAQSTTARGAVRAAEFASQELLAKVDGQQDTLAYTEKNVQSAYATLAQATARLQVAQARLNRVATNTDSSSDAVNRASADFASASSAAGVAQVKASAAGDAYQNVVSGSSAVEASLVVPASVTSTDTWTAVQQFILLALGGAALVAAIAITVVARPPARG